jgi:hypothetical protein
LELLKFINKNQFDDPKARFNVFKNMVDVTELEVNFMEKLKYKFDDNFEQEKIHELHDQ